MKIEKCFVIGIKTTTTNKGGQATVDIGQLWEKFYDENIADEIPNRTDKELLSLYCNYKDDEDEHYDTVIGCRVSSLDTIPDEMVGQEIATGQYRKFIAKGDVTRGAITQAWKTIWATKMNRTYKADFEVYGEKAQNPHDAKVNIFIGVNE